MYIFITVLSYTLLASTFVEADVSEIPIEKAAAEGKSAEPATPGEIAPLEESNLKTGSEISKKASDEVEKVKRSSETDVEEKDGKSKAIEDIEEKSGESEQKSGVEKGVSVEEEKSGQIEEKKASDEVRSDNTEQVDISEKSGASEVSLESKDAEVKSQERAAPVESVESKSHSVEDTPEVGSSPDLLSALRKMQSDPIIDAKGRNSELVSKLSRPLSKTLGALDEIGRSGFGDVNLLPQPLAHPGLLYRPSMMPSNNPPRQPFNNVPNHSYNPVLSQYRNPPNDLTANPASNAYPYAPSPPHQLTQKPFDIFSKLTEASENPKPFLSNNFYKPYDPTYNNYNPYNFARTRRFISPDRRQLPGFSSYNNFY